MDRNFKVRVLVGVAMFVVALVALYAFDAVPFKILFGLFAFVSLVELLSFFRKKFNGYGVVLAVCEALFLIGGTAFVAQTNADYFWYVILGVPGYDIFAYLFGKLCGGRIFKKSRPFPHVSKNKTWEGTVLGLLMAIGLVAIKITAGGDWATDWMYLFCGPLALCGDLFESHLKRQFKVKDSNEIVIKNPVFARLEMLVGGSEGHGGFLDRIDSTAFATSVLLVILLVV